MSGSSNPTVFLNGEYLPKSEAHLSPDDRGFLFGDGVYEVVRAYEGKFFAMKPHLGRLEKGLEFLEIDADAYALEPICRELMKRNDLEGTDAVIYMQITRGAAPRRHAFPLEPVPPTIFAQASAFAPKGDPLDGISVITVPDLRWARCDIKTVNLLGNCLANQKAQSLGSSEAIQVRDGVALEGTATSFFGVFGGEVRTAPKSNYILPSITRQTVIDVCHDSDIPIREEPIFVEELAKADELFMAGTTMEVMPVISVDGNKVADGTPGPVQRKLYELFRNRVAELSD